jgi:putative transposase
MSLDISPGVMCVFDGRVVQIDGAESLAHAIVRDTANGKLIKAPICKLRALPTGTTKKEIGYVPDAEWKRCAALARDLLDTVKQARVPLHVLSPIAQRHGLSIRQLQRLRRKLIANPRASALVRSPGGRPEGLNRLSDQVHELINHVIRKHYFRRERPAKMDIVERIRSMCRRLSLVPPSKNAIIRRIDRQLGYDADLARLGKKAALQIWEPRPGRLGALKPLEIVQIDHTLVDVLVLSDDRQTVLGRPWITLAIDVATRVVVGMYLTMNPPSSVSVSLCIEHSVLPKPEEALEPGTWPIFGKPRCFLVDNGKDLRADALKRGCDDHGIDLQWRPVRTPHYGAHIERLIGTLMRLCHLLPGTTFSNPRERGDYNSAKKAKLTLSELKAWIIEKVCRYYHVRKHRELDAPPIVAWQSALTDATGQLQLPPMVADPESFRMCFLPCEFRRVNRTGIELHGSRYWHADLAPLLNSPESAMVRYDPRSRGAIWVRLDNDVLVEAPAIAGPAAGLPAARYAVDATTAAELDRAIDKHFVRCDAIEAQAAKETRRARSKRRGGGPGAAPEAPASPLSVEPPGPSAEAAQATAEPAPSSLAPGASEVASPSDPAELDRKERTTPSQSNNPPRTKPSVSPGTVDGDGPHKPLPPPRASRPPLLVEDWF